MLAAFRQHHRSLAYALGELAPGDDIDQSINALILKLGYAEIRKYSRVMRQAVLGGDMFN